MKPQFITTDLGEKLVVLTHREYLALCARAGDEEAEDAMTEIIAAERQRDLDEGRDVVLPEWFCDAAARGDGSVLRGLRKHRGLSQVQVAECGRDHAGLLQRDRAWRRDPDGRSPRQDFGGSGPRSDVDAQAGAQPGDGRLKTGRT